MREWLVGLVGEEREPIASWVLAAGIVIILVFVVIWVAKKAFGGSMGPRAKGRGPRLAIMDVTPIDQKRKLVLVRRDEVEHLLLIGGQNDVIVEAGILRIPASARTQRLEPQMRTEPEAQASLAPAAAPAPQPVLAPAAAAKAPPTAAPQGLSPPPQQRPTVQGNPARPPEQRVSSPLTRAVPRPPVQNEDLPSQAMPADVATPARMAAVAPGPAPASGRVSAPEPSVAAAAAASPAPAALAPDASFVAPPVAAPPLRGGRREEPVFAPMAEQFVDVEAPDPRDPAPQRTDAPWMAPPVLSPAAEAATPGQSPATDPIASAPVTPVAVSTPGPTVVTANPTAGIEPPRRAAPQMTGLRAESIEPRGAGEPRLPIPARQEPRNVVPERLAQPQAALQRTAIGGGTEPVRRPVSAPTTPPVQPRSMATPTYPQKAPAVEVDDDMRRRSPDMSETAGGERLGDIADDAGARIAAPSAPKQGETLRVASMEGPTPETIRPQQTPSLAAPKPLSPPSLSPMSPIIAAAERQKESIRARATPSLPDLTALIAATAAMKSPQPLPEAASEAEDSAEKRPLSVRSFATSIQSMKPSYEPPTPLPAEAPPVLAQRTDPLPRQPLPAFAAPVVAVPVPVAAPEPPVPVPADASTSLEDFLSAELDSDFGNVSWDDEPSMPAVQPAEPKAQPLGRDAAPTVEVAAPAPRAMTLEEEMERLLGDFDFETSDRRTN